MKICIILGTRPEIIKMSPIIRECDNRGLNYFILHTGQHYDYVMDEAFFNDLQITKPKYNLQVGGTEYSLQMSTMIREIKKVCIAEKPDVVLVQGDTNTVLAGALAANKLGVKVAHHEAGLRSNDIGMSEERNRIITDSIADILFAPTKQAVNNLVKEGIFEDKIILTGNTVVDAVRENVLLAKKRSNILEKFNLQKKKYIILTLHRAENVDNRKILEDIFKGLRLVSKEMKMPMLFPAHPRTISNIKKFGIFIPKEIQVIEPLGYFDFLHVLSEAIVVLTDSGGIQEESSILHTPCVTLRENTERPESVDAGVNILAGSKPENILNSTKKILDSNKKWIDLYGDGAAGKKIVDGLVNFLKS